MTLYEIADEFQRLYEMAEEEDDEQVILDTLESIQGELEDKCDSYATVIKALDADAKTVDEEIKRLTKRKKMYNNNIDRIKKYLYLTMKALDKKTIKTPLHTFTISKNGGRPPIIMNDGVVAEDLPSELVRVTITPDMDMLRVMVEKGDTTYAHFGQRGEGIRIK